MEASLESESTRQKRQQEYGYDPRAGSRAVSSDVEFYEGIAKGQSRVGCRERSDEAGQKEGEAVEQELITTQRRTKGRAGCKVTYKRPRSRRGVSLCVSSSDDEDQNYVLERKDEVSAVGCLNNTSIRSRLRDRKNIKKPTNKFSEMILYPITRKTSRRKTRETLKKNEEVFWWKTANAVGIVLNLSLFLFTTAESYLARHVA